MLQQNLNPLVIKRFLFILSLLFVLTCAKEDSQAPNTPPSQIVKQYTLTASAGEGGSVSGEGAYEEGTQITLTATPDEGYQFVGTFTEDWNKKELITYDFMINL